VPLTEEGRAAIGEGWTTPEEVRRVLGPEFTN